MCNSERIIPFAEGDTVQCRGGVGKVLHVYKSEGTVDVEMDYECVVTYNWAAVTLIRAAVTRDAT
jgi:hypothetical protein